MIFLAILHSPCQGSPFPAKNLYVCHIPSAIISTHTQQPNDFNGEQTQAQTRILLRKMDMRILPVSALIYLLNSMDRSNVGNAKVMNQEEGHDLLTSTGLSQMQYK